MGAVAGGLVRGLFLLLVLSLVVFFLSRACPGDPLRSWYGDGVDRLSAAQKAAMRRNLGLDRSLWVQYGLWLRNLFQGSLGISLKYKRPVTAVLGSVAGNTAILGISAYLLTFLFLRAAADFVFRRENPALPHRRRLFLRHGS